VTPDAFPSDYDSDPDRWRVNRATVERYSCAGDTHEPVAERFLAEGLRPILDVGCGDGRLAGQLPAHAGWIGVDASHAQVAAAPGPAVLADASALPIRTGSCGAVAQLWMLYHLEDPVDAIAEAHRVLRPGGLYAASTSRRDDSPEVLAHLPPQPASTFDAEEAPDLVGEVFGAVEVDAWDGPYVRLPDRQAVASYLRGRGIDAETAADVVAAVDVPLAVTKRGCVVFARKLAG
jgi:SAM-dependent methyltransferase